MSLSVKKQPKSYPFANFAQFTGVVKMFAITNLKQFLCLMDRFMKNNNKTLFTRFTRFTLWGNKGKCLQSYPFYPRLLSKRVKRVKQMGKLSGGHHASV